MLMREVPFGWLLRYIHLNGASFFFLAVYFHMAKNIFYGSYLPPRYYIWLSGLFLYLLLIATAFFGYVLPWGQMSYWGATVISGLISTIPIFGQFLLSIIWGGENITTITLRRFYTLHFLCPFIILALMFLHLLFLHDVGSNNPEGFFLQDNIILHSFYSLKDFLVIFIFLFFYCFFIYFEPTILGNPVNAIMADINFTPKKMVPEWYFLPMYTILRSINSRGGGVLSLGIFFLVLFLLPFFTNPIIQNGDFKLFYQIVFFFIISIFIVLGWAGSKSLDYPWIQISRLSTLIFFILFLIILPLIELFNLYLINYRFIKLFDL
jgi:ubiquinol-cytochrome c reductase cytochrome b subunit